MGDAAAELDRKADAARKVAKNLKEDGIEYDAAAIMALVDAFDKLRIQARELYIENRELHATNRVDG